MREFSLLLGSGDDGGVAHAEGDVHNSGELFHGGQAVGFDDDGVVAGRAAFQAFPKLLEGDLLILKIEGRNRGSGDADDQGVSLWREKKWGVGHGDFDSRLKEERGAENDEENERQNDIQRGRDEHQRGMQAWRALELHRGFPAF